MSGPSIGRGRTRSRLADVLGVRRPIIQGPFGGGLSSIPLTVAVSNAGALGSYGANHLDPDQISSLVSELKRRTSHAFNVNLWVPLPGEAEVTLDEVELAREVDRLRPYLDELGVPPPAYRPTYGQSFDRQVAALIDARPPVFSFIFGVPPAAVLDEARRRGIVTVGTATTVDEAVALEAAGVDVIVASGSDAGGHRGAFLAPVAESLVGTFSLVPQVVDAVTVPVVAAGGIADRRGVAAALALGADGVQIGTGFLMTTESVASAAHKRALAGPGARITVLTSAFSGRPARAIPNRFSRELAALERDLPPYPIQSALTSGIRSAAAERGLADYLNLWAGQAARLARPRTAQDYLDELDTPELT